MICTPALLCGRMTAQMLLYLEMPYEICYIYAQGRSAAEHKQRQIYI